MRKKLTSLCVVLLMLWLCPAALAELNKSCTLSADSTTAAPGETVSIDVSISDNPGYTNFAIALDYDREKLELESITPNTGAGLSAVNTEYIMDSVSYGFMNTASAEPVYDNGTLFTAKFLVKEAAEGEAEVKPILLYMRDNSAVFSVFEEIGASISFGAVNIESSQSTPQIKYGDVNFDGRINSNDAALTYGYINGSWTFTDEQKLAADVNSDSKINSNDAATIYLYVNKSISIFPAEQEG